VEQVNQWQEESARKELPLLDKFALELEALTRDMFTSPITFQPLNGADVMALSFATKQLEHLRSVRALIAVGSHRDAQLIARTMLEAQGTLRWAFKRAPERTELWFWYGAILDWRQIAKNKSAGIKVDAGDEATLKPFVDLHGPDYYKPNVRKGLEKAQKSGTTYKLPNDPWHPTDWTELSARDMFKELGPNDDRLYNSFYRRTSEWGHSGPRAILIAADSNQTNATEWGAEQFRDDDVQSGVWALGVACESILQSLKVLNAHFSLGREQPLLDIEDRFNAKLAESLATAP
jgi:hypothetical protein